VVLTGVENEAGVVNVDGVVKVGVVLTGAEKA